jgi:hypothetical protein
VVVNAAASAVGSVAADDVDRFARYVGTALRGKAVTDRRWVWGMGFGVPLVPDVWKTCDIPSELSDTASASVDSLTCTTTAGRDGSSVMVALESSSPTEVARSRYFGWNIRWVDDVCWRRPLIAEGEHWGLVGQTKEGPDQPSADCRC